MLVNGLQTIVFSTWRLQNLFTDNIKVNYAKDVIFNDLGFLMHSSAEKKLWIISVKKPLNSVPNQKQ